MENSDQAIPGTIELINRLHQKLTVPVTSTADALAKQRKLGEQGWAPAQVPDGGYFFPHSMNDNFDFRLIGGRYFEFKKKNRNDREVTVKCVEHLGLIYTCRDLPEEEGGQEKGAKVKYSRGGKPTDRPHIKEGAGGNDNKPGYVSLITFAGGGRSIAEYEKPRGSAQTAQRPAAAPAARPAAEPASVAAQTQTAPAPTAAATQPAPVATATAPAAGAAPPESMQTATPARALASVPPKVDLQARWTALGRKREDIAPWLAEFGITLQRGVEPTDEQKATIHDALLKLERKSPSPLDRWKALGEDPKAFVGWLTSLGITIPAQGYFDPATTARISAALSDLEAQAAEITEFETAAQ
jgi:hypothetical protein